MNVPSELVCVGGPAHGQIVGWQGNDTLLPIDCRTEEVLLMDTSTPPRVVDMRPARYTLDEVKVAAGDLMLSGSYYRYYNLSRSEAPRLAMGLILARALR